MDFVSVLIVGWFPFLFPGKAFVFKVFSVLETKETKKSKKIKEYKDKLCMDELGSFGIRFRMLFPPFRAGPFEVSQ